MSLPADPDEIFEAIAGRQATELRDHLVVPQERVLYHLGTTTPVLGTVPVSQGPGGLILTGRPGATPLDYMGAYVSLHDYMRPIQPLIDNETHRELVVQRAIEAVGTRRMMLILVVLDRCVGNPTLIDPLEAQFTARLVPNDRDRLVNLRRPGPDQRAFLARHVILAALRLVLSLPEVAGPAADPPFGEFAGIFLCHAVAEKLSSQPPTSGSKIGRFDAELAVEIIRNGIFNATDDAYSMIDRHLRIWRDYESVAAPKISGRTPRELFLDATSIEMEDFLALGFALVANTLAWAPGQPIFIAEEFSNMDPTIRETFLAWVTASPDEMSAAISKRPDKEWDMLAFQARPVLRCPQGLLVIDLILLVDRITEGTYWDVHDHQKGISESARERWTQAWGAAVEAMAEDDLRPLAPPDLAGGRSFYTEEDLERAYPRSQRADVVIDFGTAFVAVEVVSGQFSTATRIDGDLAALRRDVDRLIVDKSRQLDSTAKNLVHDQKRLTGHDGPRRPVYPVIVVGGGVSLNPILASYVKERTTTEGLFTGSFIEPLSVIDMSELEMLEGLAGAKGCTPVELLSNWHASGLREMPLHNWLLSTYVWDPAQYRPARMRPHVDATLADLVARLGLPEDSPTE